MVRRTEIVDDKALVEQQGDIIVTRREREEDAAARTAAKSAPVPRRRSRHHKPRPPPLRHLPLIQRLRRPTKRSPIRTVGPTFIRRSNSLRSCFDPFSSREAASTSLENALAIRERPPGRAPVRATASSSGVGKALPLSRKRL